MSDKINYPTAQCHVMNVRLTFSPTLIVLDML